jgi:hypothetical protein
VTDAALRDLMKQIHDEAAVLRAVAREADLEMTEYVAAARAKRTSERLRGGMDEPDVTVRGPDFGERGSAR